MKMKEKKKTREKKIPESKVKIIREISKLLKDNCTIMIASVKSLPSSQFQEIRKKLRGKAEIKIVKKNLMLRAIDSIEKGSIQNLKQHVQEDSAVLFSELDAFELAGLLADYKSPAKAKAGQIAEENIEVEAGPTDLVPGPVISELGSLGLKIAVEDGKISIKENKVIVKKGDAINETASGLMAKFNMLPFKVGLEPLVVYDAKEEKIFTGIKIDKKKTLEDLKYSFVKALAFAVSLAYPCKDTIRLLIQKAGRQELALAKLSKPEPAETKPEETPSAEQPTQTSPELNSQTQT